MLLYVKSPSHDMWGHVVVAHATLHTHAACARADSSATCFSASLSWKVDSDSASVVTPPLSLDSAKCCSSSACSCLPDAAALRDACSMIQKRWMLRML